MLTADKDSRRRGEEGTGEVESLHGRMKGQKMGDRLDKGSKPEVRREGSGGVVASSDTTVRRSLACLGCAPRGQVGAAADRQFCCTNHPVWRCALAVKKMFFCFF